MSGVFQRTVYHKSDATKAQINCVFQEFNISRDKPNKELWLGDGIYFWEKQSDAEWWPGQYENETILSAKLSCPYDRYVNLDQREEKEAFKEFCRQTKELMELQPDIRFEFSNGRFQVSSFFYNVFKQTYDILLLKYSFPERRSFRPQYCASDNDIVSEVQIVARLIANRWEWC